LQATYIEDPTTDAETDSLVNFVPGEIVVDTQAYFGVVRANSTFTPYLRKNLDLTAELNGRLTQLSLRAYSLRRQYLAVPLLGSHDLTRGAVLIVKRELSPLTTATLSARIDDAYALNGFVYHDHRYAADVTHSLSPTLEITLQAVHLQRAGTSQYSANVGALTVRKTF
jgi:hypothetical protein